MISDGDLAPSLRGKFFSADPRFLKEVFRGKNFHFRGKNFFLVIDQIYFQIFPFFSQIFPIFAIYVKCHNYLTISSQQNTFFLLCSYFDAHPTTLLL